MIVGTVAVDDNGVVTGSGAARRLYDAILAAEGASLPNPDAPDDDWEDTAAAWKAAMTPFVVKSKKAYARTALEHATALARSTPTNVSASTVLGLNNELVVVGTRAAAVSLTLPAAAEVGDEVQVVDGSGQAASFAISFVAPSGQTVVGAAITNAYGRRAALKVSATAWVVSGW